jgi:hypothetical protein
MNQKANLSTLPTRSKLRPQKKTRLVRESRKLRRHESLIIFIVNLVLHIGLGYLFNQVLLLGNGDAYSRTANAYYVLYSRDPHLAAIGFIWPPLPSLLQLPLLPILRPFDLTLMAAPLQLAPFSAGTIVLLNIVLARFNLPEKLRWLLVILIMFQPNYLYLSAIGMSEPFLTFCILVTIWGYLQMPYGTRSWVICGAGMALAFLVRYESLGLMAGAVFAVIILFWNTVDENWSELEGRLLSVLVPPIYAIGVWVFMNWMIMDDPFYFLLSEYSLTNAGDTAKMAGNAHPLYLAWGNIFLSISYMIKRTIQQNLAVLPATLLVLPASILQKKPKYIGLLFIFVGIPALSDAHVFIGSFPTWFRYWLYAGIFGVLLIAMTYNLFKGFWRNIFVAVLTLLAALSIPFSLHAMLVDDTIEADLKRFAFYMFDREEEVEWREVDGFYINRHDAPIIADKIDELTQESLVMLDAKMNYYVVLDVDQPERLVINNDSDFYSVVTNPRGKVGYVLVPDTINIFDAIYPGIYDGIYDWTELVYEFEDTMVDYRVFKILP